jgi:hypothetical protein
VQREESETTAYMHTPPATIEDWKAAWNKLAAVYNLRCDEWMRYREALERIVSACGDDSRPEDNAVQIAREALS